MNIHEIELLLIVMMIVSLIPALYIYLENRSCDFHKPPQTPEFRQSEPTFAGFRPVDRRRKIESNPTIVCSLPIHQTVRPEAPLS